MPKSRAAVFSALVLALAAILAAVRADARTALVLLTMSAMVMVCLLSLAVTAARRRSAEARLRRVLEGAAVGIVEADYTEAADLLDELRSRGVSDLRAHFDEHPDALTRFYGLAKIRSMNPATRAMLEFRPGDRLETPVPLCLPETAGVIREHLVRLWEGRRNHQAEVTFKTLSGQHTEALVTASFPSDLRREHVILTLTDLGPRKEEERVRNLSEERLKHAVRLTGLGIFEHDLVRDVVYTSPEAATIAGFRPDEPATLAAWFERVVPEDRPAAIAALTRSEDPESGGFQLATLAQMLRARLDSREPRMRPPALGSSAHAAR